MAWYLLVVSQPTLKGWAKQRGGPMKRLLLTSALLGLAGTIGTANAEIISDTVTIWSAATPGATSTTISQQGLPTATGLFGGPLPLVAASTPYAHPIAYNDQANNTIGGFFTTAGNPVPATLAAPGAALSGPQFQPCDSISVHFYRNYSRNLLGHPR
jgi:hypothetical protein